MFAKEGLEGVVAARTSICLIKGAEGAKAALEYRGYSIHDLANHCGFEEVAYLLWYGALPSADELRDFSRLMRAQSHPPPPRVARARLDPSRPDADRRVARRSLYTRPRTIPTPPTTARPQMFARAFG